MIRAILDTNVIVQAVIGSPRGTSAGVLVAYGHRRYRLIFSLPTLEELHTVLTLPAMRQRHGWSDDHLGGYFKFLLANLLGCLD